jgi:hypothetical protein
MPNGNPALDETQINNQAVDPPINPRPVLSSLDTWDQNTQIDYPFPAQNQQGRPGWNVPSVAVTNESVNTIQESQNTRFVSNKIATLSGVIPDPSTNLTQFRTVPNMSQVLYTDANVQITFSINAATTPAPDTANFAIFRDRVQISQVYHLTTVQSGVPTLLSGSYTDTRAGKLDNHTYDLRWHTSGNSRITAFGKDRTFQASNLRAQ